MAMYANCAARERYISHAVDIVAQVLFASLAVAIRFDVMRRVQIADFNLLYTLIQRARFSLMFSLFSEMCL